MKNNIFLKTIKFLYVFIFTVLFKIYTFADLIPLETKNRESLIEAHEVIEESINNQNFINNLFTNTNFQIVVATVIIVGILAVAIKLMTMSNNK